MRERRLEDAAARAGARLRTDLYAIAARHAGVKEVRGLTLGMELVTPTGEPAGLLDDLGETVKDLRVLTGKTGPGRNVLTLMPSLVITDAEVDQVLHTLDQVFAGLPTRSRVSA